MYIKINNNIVTDYADWEFEGSHFVDIEFSDYLKNKERFAVINGKLTDLAETEEYKNKKKLEQIDDELYKIDELYAIAGQEPIEFEGHLYKFEWTSLYQGLLNSGILPAKIWDLTELEENAVIMDEEQLQSLQNCLLVRQENAFQTRKSARSILLTERENIKKLIGD